MGSPALGVARAHLPSSWGTVLFLVVTLFSLLPPVVTHAAERIICHSSYFIVKNDWGQMILKPLYQATDGCKKHSESEGYLNAMCHHWANRVRVVISLALDK